MCKQGLAALIPPTEAQEAAAAGSDLTTAAAAAGQGKDDSSNSSSSRPRQRLVLLGDAVAYLSDIVSAGAGGDEVLLEAARVALRQATEQLELARLQR